MNKCIDTSIRLFMAVVRPSGSGKTELIFQFLNARNFYLKFRRVLFSHKDNQLIAREKFSDPSFQIEIGKFDGLDRLRNIENILQCLMTHAKKFTLKKNSLNWQRQEDTIASMLSMVNITYSNKADENELLI